MTVVKRVELPLDGDEFLGSLGDSLQRPEMREAALLTFATARELVNPTMVYDWFPVSAGKASRAKIGGQVFRLGRHADLLLPALVAFVGVVTIAPDLETRSKELQTAGEALNSYLLDSAGVFAIGKLIEHARSMVEEYAADRGWGVGAELAPGQLSGWPIAEQHLIDQLLDLSSIGVHVTDSGMLVPLKSASVVVGAGPEYESSAVRSPCEYCDVSDTCRYRH
jgi:hypothetical protein